MISPVSPYKICAVIYYQGESDVGHPNRYALEFRALVNDWRKSWKEKQLPIIYVQLAGFSDGNIKKQGTQWVTTSGAQSSGSSQDQKQPHHQRWQPYLERRGSWHPGTP